MTFLNCRVFSSTKNSALDSMQKTIFKEVFSFFQEYSWIQKNTEDNGTIFNKPSEEQIDM